MKNNKILIVLLLLVLNSCVKAMDFFGFLDDSEYVENPDFIVNKKQKTDYSFEINSRLYETFQEESKTDLDKISSVTTSPDFAPSFEKFKHTDKRRKRHTCKFDGCKVSYTLIGDLKKHIESAHEGKRYTCVHDGCNKSFTKACNLQRHINSSHKGKRHACTHDGCNKLFTAIGSLNRHIDSKHQEKRHVCTYDGCDKSFTDKSSLKRHIDSKHKSNGESNEK